MLADDALYVQPIIWLLWWQEKQDHLFIFSPENLFSIHFSSKKTHFQPCQTLKTLSNQYQVTPISIHCHQKPNKPPQKPKIPELRFMLAVFKDLSVPR